MGESCETYKEGFSDRCRAWVLTNCSRPGRLLPGPGDVIRTNYGTGLYTGYVVVAVNEDTRFHRGAYYFEVRPNSDDPEAKQARGYLGRYFLIEDGRLVGRSYPPGSAGWESNGGGRDEIWIERRTKQGRLF